jgi:2-polyprenyl-6-methoxyphenol hydroxylase-like FAD-dependent oxidoreductase
MPGELTNFVDVVIVGGGIAGSALAAVLARAGLAVTVLEQQRFYADRVRGEYMASWGVEIAQRLGLFEALNNAGGSMPRWAVQYDELMPPEAAEQHKIDINGMVPGVNGVLCVSHPVACETLAREAVTAGARMVNGVENVRIQRKSQPSVTYRSEGQDTTILCRMIVGADGRNSTVRQQAGVELHEDKPANVVVGLLVKDAPEWPQDTFALGSEGDVMFLAFPQGDDRVRLYLCITPDQRDRFAGPDGTARFLDAFRLKSMPLGVHLAEATPSGPCATLGGEDTWTDTPYAEGVVLIGDAAGYNNPIIGQGLSLAMRDVELVAHALLENSDWQPSMFASYGEDRAERMRRVRFTARLHADLFCRFAPEGVQRRGSFLGRIGSGQDQTLFWQIVEPVVGPYNLPPEAFDESYRARVLGLEDATAAT